MNNGKVINLEEMGDDEMLRVFLRKVWPEVLDAMEPYFSRLRAGEKFNAIEMFAMLQLWRELISYIWMGHSPRQQPAFETLIREDWLAVREAQQHIYQKCEAELERRKAMS